MRTELEPGILRVFRWYAGIRWAVLLLVWMSARGANPPDPPQFPVVGLVLFGLLLLLLIAPGAQKLFGKAYLPVAIILATVAPILDAAATIAGRLNAGYSPNIALGDYWLSFFLLFVPFILVAWQYRYRSVVFFAIASTVFDMAIVGTLLEPTNANLSIVGALVLARGVLFAFLGLFISKLVARQREARAALEAQAAAMEQLATGRERNRLARELHDTLAHSMTATAVQLEAVSALWDDDPEQAKRLLQSALDRTRGGLGEARRAIEALRATPLEDHGLVGAIHWLADEAHSVSGVETHVTGPEETAPLPPELEQAAFRIADEAITNAVRHADATRIDVGLELDASTISVKVTDDGKGFDPTVTQNGHHGIRGMRERAELVNGTLGVESSPDGTTVSFSAPAVKT
ncbi:MAG: sensor histidine kinase [Actinobacteria bacterium]|nr:MAG: sensor histidine kinase [Actinomycetota bacterium]